MAERSSSASAYLLVPIVLAAALLCIAVIRGPSLVSLSGFGSAIIVAAPLILATYALMAVAIAGRGTVDLAVGPLLAFINVSVVQLNGIGAVTSPIGFFAVALAIGVAYQVIFALIIIYVRVQPIIVALSGFLALSGINLVILPRPGGIAPEWIAPWGFGDTIFSPILLILVVATGGWLLFTRTTFYRHLRAMGYDERAAFTSGVRTHAVRIGAHAISGLFVGLGAICYTALIASGDPTQGTTMTLTAVTALVLGGVALSGGRGSVVGALLGAINLFLIGYVLATFSFGAVQAFVTQLFYGVILVLSLLLTLLVPVIARYLAFVSPFAAFVALAAVVGSVMLHVATEDTYVIEAAVAGARAQPVGVAAGVIDRFRLLPDQGVAGTGIGWPMLTPVQQAAFATAATVAVIAFTLRILTAEAISMRFGVFLYLFIGAMVLALLLLAAGSGRAEAPAAPASVQGGGR